MWKARSIHHSFSSQTSPGFTSPGAFTVRPCCSANTLNTGWRKPIHRPDVGLVRGDVVALGADAHGQDVVREPGRLATRRGEGDVAADQLLVREHLQPREAVRVRPHRVVDAREVGVEPAPPLLQEVGQQDRQLVVRASGYSIGQVSSFQLRRAGGGFFGGTGMNLFHPFGLVPPSVPDRSGEHVQQQQAPRRLPATLVARRRMPASCGMRAVRERLGR